MTKKDDQQTGGNWPSVRNFVGPMEDRLAIRELLESYGDAIIRRDQILWSGCWAENARWQPLNEIISGRGAITREWTNMMKTGRDIKGSFNRSYFSVVGALKIDGDVAEGWSYTHELLVDDNNMTYHLNGMYSDHYVREAGQWVYAERIFKKLHIDRPY